MLVNNLRWILPLVVFIGAIVDAILVTIYMCKAHPWLDILSTEETKEETENLFIVSPGQAGPEGEGLMESQPNLSPDSVQIKDESVKEPRALQAQSELF